MRSNSSSAQQPASIDSGATSVKISVVDFVDSSRDLEPASGPSLVEIVARQTGSILNAGAIVAVAAMLLWFGVRPGLRMAFAPPRIAATEDARGASGGTPALGAPDGDGQPGESILIETDCGSRRIHAGAARAARQWSRTQTA